MFIRILPNMEPVSDILYRGFIVIPRKKDRQSWSGSGGIPALTVYFLNTCQLSSSSDGKVALVNCQGSYIHSNCDRAASSRRLKGVFIDRSQPLKCTSSNIEKKSPLPEDFEAVWLEENSKIYKSCHLLLLRGRQAKTSLLA